MLIHWIWFSLRKLPDWQKKQLLEQYADAEEIYLATGFADSFSEKQRATLEDKDLTRAREIEAKCNSGDIGILPFFCPEYPDRLRNIEDPPMVLYYKGSLPRWEEQPLIGIVGTRKASAYGMETALRFGRQIARCGALVVSGAAFGVDTMAMQGALSAQCATVGVLGCGVDVVYPKSNKELFEAIAEQGCLISEYPPGQRPYPGNFPRRNRIISGISNGILVVEAPEESGALITARDAREQGRDVFTVPGNLDNPCCVGSNRLLQKGAFAALNGWDVVKEYAALYPNVKKDTPDTEFAREAQTLLVAQNRIFPGKSEEKDEPVRKKGIDKEEKSSYSVCESLPPLTQQEAAVLEQIPRESLPLDDLLARLELPAGTALSILTRLTLKGLVMRHPGKRISRK